MRPALAVLAGVLTPLALALWPAPSPAVHADLAAHADHAPAAPPVMAHTAIPAGEGADGWDHALPAWPAGGRVLEVSAGGAPEPGAGRTYPTLAAALADAQDGDRVVLHGGTHPGPVQIHRRIWLDGRDGATVAGPGRGTVIALAASGARATGLRVTGSGGSLDDEDAGIMMSAADTLALGCDLSEIQFGIVAKNAPGAWIAGNRVQGRSGDLSLNGGGIRVWFSNGARVIANTVMGTREILVEQTTDSVVVGNAVVDGRQGIHLMRAPGAVVARNYVAGNSTGIYVMYGAQTVLESNRVVGHRGPSGYGIALKEADGARIADNVLQSNRIGLYLDNSPRDAENPNTATGNLVAYNDIGVALTPATGGNRIWQNDFLENQQQVSGSGSGALGENLWTVAGRGNYWSDYLGYDSDGDRVGDSAHAPVRVFEGWMDRHPDLRWFWFTPASAAVDLAAKAFPLAAPDPVFTDSRPAMTPSDRRDSLWSILGK